MLFHDEALCRAWLFPGRSGVGRIADFLLLGGQPLQPLFGHLRRLPCLYRHFTTCCWRWPASCHLPRPAPAAG
jgi:hypothetical protein